MTNLPTAAEIADLIEFLRSELDERILMGIPRYMGAHRSALAIAERLPALVAERGRLALAAGAMDREVGRQSEEIAGYHDDIARLTKERDDADNAIRKIGLSLGSSDEWTDQATMIGDVDGRVARLSRENAALREALANVNKMIVHGPIDEPAHSERNGMVLAYNCFSTALAQLDAPPAEAPHPAVARALFRSAEVGACGGAAEETIDITPLTTADDALRTTMRETFNKIAQSQEPLGAEFAKVLHDGFHDLVDDAVSADKLVIRQLDTQIAELCQTIAEAVEIIKPMARAYDGRPDKMTLTWVRESIDEARATEHQAVTLDFAAARAFVDKWGKK